MSDVLKVKELRELTGISIGQCKAALDRADNNIDRAMEILREWGAIGAEARRDRKCSEGRVVSYVHGEGRVGVLLQVNCETDFVAKSDDFKAFIHEMCLQVAATRPICVSRDDIPVEKIEKETEILRGQAAKLNKPEAIQERMVKGQLEKWFTEICLMDQVWVKDGTKRVHDLLNELVQKTGENIYIRRFARFEAGSA